MSVCGQPEEESASEEPGAPLREQYEPKAVSKVVRVLTVLAYLLSVSLAAILLSVYYVCVWKSPELPPANGTEGQVARRQADPHLFAITDASLHNFTGGGGVTITEDDTSQTVPANITSDPMNSSLASSEPSFLDTVSASLIDNGTNVVGVDNSSAT